MGTIITGDFREFGTEGEKAFYKFLEGAAKPDAHYLCWYLLEVNGKEPDFLLYCECQATVIRYWRFDRSSLKKSAISIVDFGLRNSEFKTFEKKTFPR